MLATAELQALVDALSAELGQPVLLDDPALAPLAYSRQWEVDGVRSQSILGRGATPAVRAALLAQGIADADGPLRTRPVAELAMQARVCIPVRQAGAVVAYLWLLDPDGRLGGDALARAVVVAERVAHVVAADEPALGLLRDERALVAALCGDVDHVARGAALAQLRSRTLVPDGPFVVCVIGARGHERVARGAVLARLAGRVSVAHALAGGRRAGGGGAVAGDGGAVADGGLVAGDGGQRRVVTAAGGDDVVLLLSLADPALAALWRPEIAGRLLSALRERPSLAVALGLSGELDSIEDAPRGLREATVALRVARSQPASEAQASWDVLRADRLIGQLPSAALDDLPSGLVELLARDRPLATTLEAYLDAAGDVPRVATALDLHRSGVYYRLKRIEQATGLDLRRGEDRLLAHLALRLLRLGEH